MQTFSNLLQDHFDTTPDRVCVTLLHAGQPDRPVTYRELIHGSERYASALAAQGIQPGEVVLLILHHGIDLLFAYFGAVLHGAVPSVMPFLTDKLLPERYRADLAALVSVTRPAMART